MSSKYRHARTSNPRSVDAETDSGATPLGAACEAGHAPVAELLRRHGAQSVQACRGLPLIATILTTIADAKRDLESETGTGDPDLAAAPETVGSEGSRDAEGHFARLVRLFDRDGSGTLDEREFGLMMDAKRASSELGPTTTVGAAKQGLGLRRSGQGHGRGSEV